MAHCCRTRGQRLDRQRRRRRRWRSSPSRTEPWVNLAGWWGPDRFYAGGEVLSADDITHVRLTTRDGIVLEDDTKAGIVLFLTARTVELPVTLELLDTTGQVVASQLALGMPG
jgi:hypothetical protein